MLKYRLVSGPALIGLGLLMVFGRAPAAEGLFLAVLALTIVGALREFFAMTGRLGHVGYPVLTAAAGLAFGAVVITAARGSMKADDAALLQSVLILAFVIAGFVLVFCARDLKAGLGSLFVSIAAFVYIPWMLSFGAVIYFVGSPEARTGPYLLLFLVLVTKCGDIGGYTFGTLSARRASGNHKLAPRLSPKKSWEGLLGSVIFSLAAALLLLHCLGPRLTLAGRPAFTPATAVAAGLALALIGLLGDLCESVLKRASATKDSGRTIPGMGGVLDVADSLILATPVFAIYLKLAT